MNIIDNIRIENLWGEVSLISIKFDRKYNFIIGKNGTGKTTIINLIAAILSADFHKLDRIQFDRVVVVLKTLSANKKPIIEVTKRQKEGLPYCDITYIFRESSSGESISYDLDALERERYYRGVPSRMVRDRQHHKFFADIEFQLKQYVEICWLSVHRYSDDLRVQEESKNLPSIDRKIVALNNALVRYFSQISRQYSDQLLEFQKKSFLSVLTPDKNSAIFALASSMDIEREREALQEVFSVLGVEKKQYGAKLKTHFDKFVSAKEAMEQRQALTTDDFASLYNAWRTHSLVQDYEELQKKRDEVFRSRNTFVDLLNVLLDGRKKISISESNELVVQTKMGRPIPLEELSSGEKQLLIILGEALLQHSKPTVYIADEPELSLHVVWQEQLTNVITMLNPNAQIVFATHSPDIVNGHSDKVIDMESRVS